MIGSVRIKGYRGLNDFEMTELGQVNLLVGRNNSGKSSVLEALFLQASGGDPWALWQISARRGERIEVLTGRNSDAELDLSHLFHGHELRVGARLSIRTQNMSARNLELSIEESSRNEPDLLPPETEEPPTQRLVVKFGGQPSPAVSSLPLTSRGGLRFESIDSPRRLRRTNNERPRAQYISTESLSSAELTAMWNEVVLTDAEERVLAALRFLEPKIERLAATSAPRDYYYPSSSRGGFKIKLRGTDQPIPIGSLGDGIWRMLAMAISIVRAKDSILLVDEIDTGLHYSVLEDMWKLISETASKFNVQVFATTHSQDCVNSLATICTPSNENRTTIQRIEASKKKSIPFNEAEIRTAASNHIEMR